MIPVIFIDELILESYKQIRLLRNISRCIAFPCVLASTNLRISNMLKLNLNGDSSCCEGEIWVKVVRKLPPANLRAIFNNFDPLSDFVQLKEVQIDYEIIRPELKVDNLVEKFEISSNENSKMILKRIFNILVLQSKTCNPGVAHYIFRYFLKALKIQRNKELDCSVIWENIIEWFSVVVRIRKEAAFEESGVFFSLLAFDTNVILKCDESSIKRTSSAMEFTDQDYATGVTVQNSINRHFYSFGGAEEPGILSFMYTVAKELFVQKEVDCLFERYYLKSFFPNFKDDMFLHFALWSKIELGGSIATILKLHKDKLIANPKNSNARFCGQESMAYWSVADSSHKSSSGRTSGADFVKGFIKNVQTNPDILKLVEADQLNSVTGFGFVDFSIPDELLVLKRFLDRIIVPYLLPEEPNNLLRAIKDICQFGHCYRCPNKTGLDISFDVLFDGILQPAFVECKYTKEHEKVSEVIKYAQRAWYKRSRLTFYLTFSLESSLKEANPNNTLFPDRLLRSGKKEFPISLYSVFYDVESLKIISLQEAIDADSVFFIIQTNFQIPQI